MEASHDKLRNRSDSENQRTNTTAVKGQAVPSLALAGGLRGVNASSHQQQVVVPTCSTGRSASSDNSSAVGQTKAAPLTVVFSTDQRGSADSAQCNLLLPPLLLFSTDKSQSKKCSNSALGKTPSEKTTSVPAKHDGKKTANSSMQLSAQTASIELNCDEQAETVEDLRDGRDSSVEAEDSLGTLLSKHFDTDPNEDGGGLASSDIAKQRLLLGRARIRHVCVICNRECPSKHKLRRHLSTHSDERPFTCQACGKTFKWTEYLQKHIRQQHSNGIEGSPASPLATSSTAQSQTTPDTPSSTASLTASPPTPSPTITVSSRGQSLSHTKKKQLKQNSRMKQNKSSRSKSQRNPPKVMQSECPLHCGRVSSQDSCSVEVTSMVLSESEPSETKDKDNEEVDSLLVSIPKMHNVSVGVNMDEDGQLPTVTQSPSQAMDALDLTLEKINASTSPGQSANISTVVSAIMAEPIPTNCIGNGSAVNATSHVTSGGTSTQGEGSSNTNMSRNQGFGQDYQYCFPLNSTSNNNSDSMLSQDYPPPQLLNTDTPSSSLSSYSPGLLQQTNQSLMSHDHSMSAQSDSNSIQMTTNDPFSLQQENQNPISQTQNQLPLNLSSSMQPPDLIPINSQFSMLHQQTPNMLLDQQLQDMSNFTYGAPLNNQYSMFGSTGQPFDGDSLTDDLGMSGLGYQMQMPGLGICDNYLSGPSYLDIQQARQLLYENTQQMRRILKSYQTLQNTLLRVTAGTHAAMLPSAFNSGLMDNQQLFLNQQRKDHMMHQQQNDSHMTQLPDQLINHQLNSTNDHMTQPENHMIQPVQSHDIPDVHLSDHMMCTQQPNPPCTSSSETMGTQNSFDSPSNIISCEPSELLAPLTEQEDLDLPPPEKRPRLEISSSCDVGIQCELGPETIVALIEEELNGEQDDDNEDVEEPTSVSTELQSPEDTPLITDTLEPSKMDRMINKYPCEVDGCKKAYVHRKDLTRHMKIRHGVLPKTLKPVAMETAEKPYVCPVESCGRSYYHMRDLRRHQRACHRVNSQAEIDSQSTTNSSKEEQACEQNGLISTIQLRFPCDYPGCVRSYVHKKDLVRHKRLYHKDISSKPSVPGPIPYSDSGLRVIRHEVKQEVEQLMKKNRLESSSSTRSSSVSTDSDTSSLLNPDALLTTLSNDVFVSLGIATSSDVDKDLAETPISANTAQIISLIQTLTTTSTPQVGEIPQFPLPITLPVIPVLPQNHTNTLPEVFTKTSGESSCEKLKEVLSEPPSLLPVPTIREPNATGSYAKEKEPVVSEESSLQDSTVPSANCDIQSLLDISAHDLVASSGVCSLVQQSPKSLASLAAAALSVVENELSTVLITTGANLSPPTSATPTVTMSSGSESKQDSIPSVNLNALCTIASIDDESTKMTQNGLLSPSPSKPSVLDDRPFCSDEQELMDKAIAIDLSNTSEQGLVGHELLQYQTAGDTCSYNTVLNALIG